MTQTFTKTDTSTINVFEMTEPETSTGIGVESDLFYNSIRVELDMIERAPTVGTVQNILDHSQNLR